MPSKAGHKAAVRDPSVELDISGKAIADNELSTVTEALVQAVAQAEGDEQIMKLEEAYLKGNELTASSLAAIAPVIKLSAHSLRDLDLADNKIEISTPEDGRNWELFLRALDSCCVLRRLDLSGNPLGSKAFELLFKVYTAPDPSVSRGLRSIPYVILVDTEMDDTSALHLSYIVSNHSSPEQLLPQVFPAKPGAQTQLLEAYDAVPGCQGIIYRPNARLGTAGTRVLELAEQARVVDHSTNDQGPEQGSIPTNAMRELSLLDSDTQLMTPDTRRRRSSTNGIISSSLALRSGELDRARSRIQGDTLRDKGLSSNDLWRAAMQMLGYARVILLRDSPLRTDWASRANYTPIKHMVSPETRVRASSMRASSSSSSFWNLENGFPRLSGSHLPPMSAPKKPLASANPNASINPRQPPSRKNSLMTPHGPITFHNGPSSRVRAEEVHLPPSPATDRTDDEPAYRTILPCGFSEEIWTQILAAAAGADQVLGLSQQRAVVRWAMDKRTLVEEMGVLGKSESQQIWKVLHGMGCLAYGDGAP